jgi:hypothetical protein
MAVEAMIATPAKHVPIIIALLAAVAGAVPDGSVTTSLGLVGVAVNGTSTNNVGIVEDVVVVVVVVSILILILPTGEGAYVSSSLFPPLGAFVSSTGGAVLGAGVDGAGEDGAGEDGTGVSLTAAPPFGGSVAVIILRLME